MRMIRLNAAFLVLFTLVTTAVLFRSGAAGPALPAVIGFAAVCLAAIVPIDAVRQAERNRVFLACVVYTVLMAVSLVAAHFVDAPLTAEVPLAGLGALGVVLCGWAMSTKNRRRRTGWNGYYDG